MADVFISHSSKDHIVSEQLCEGLEANGISCWIAPRDITAGTEWAVAINNAISTSKVFLIVYSERSAQSKQVSKELGLAGARGIPMIPYKIDSTPLAAEFEYYLLTSHWIAADDSTGDYKFGELLAAVKALLGQGSESVPVLQTVPPQPVQQEIPVQPTKGGETSDKKKKLIPIIAAAAALVAVIAIVLAVVLSGGSGERADGGSTAVSGSSVDNGGAGESGSQSEPETPPVINSDALLQVGVDIQPIESEACRVLANSYDESFFVGGVKYNTGVLLTASNSKNTVLFNVDGAYEKMSFRAGRVDGTNYDNDMTVRVYFDDNEQQPITLTNYDISKLCEFDITDVKTVRIQCDHRSFAPDIALTDFYISSTEDSGIPSSYTSPFDESADMLAIPTDYAPYDSAKCRWLADSFDESFYVAGVKYNTGIILNADQSNNTMAFNVNGAFEKLSFRVGRVDGTHYDGDLTVRVYLDGKEQQPITLTNYNITKLCEYDITGTKQIRIECDNRSFAPEIAFTDFYLCKSADAEVSSSFTSPFDESVEIMSVPCDFVPYDSAKCRWLADSFDESFYVAGVKYNTGIILNADQSNNTMAFNVNGAFEKLSFRVGRVDGTHYDGDLTVRVYLDGKEQQPITLTNYNITKLCEYDITGTKQIRIECDNRSFAPEIAFTDFYLCKSADAEVSSSFTSPFDESVEIMSVPCDFVPYDSAKCRWLADSFDESFYVAGVKYNTGIILNADQSNNTVAFNVNGVYKKLSFSTGMLDGSDYDGEITVRVYLDGKEQQPITLSPGSIKMCEYDITDAKQIRIECDNRSFAPNVGFVDMTVSK